MLLREGKIVRFKGPTAESEAMIFEAELNGKGTREGTTVLIKQTVRLAVTVLPYWLPTQLDGIEPGMAIGPNGRRDASR